MVLMAQRIMILEGKASRTTLLGSVAVATGIAILRLASMLGKSAILIAVGIIPAPLGVMRCMASWMAL